VFFSLDAALIVTCFTWCTVWYWFSSCWPEGHVKECSRHLERGNSHTY